MKTQHTNECLKAREELDNAPMMSGSSICVCKKHTPTPWTYDYKFTHDIITDRQNSLDVLAIASCVLKNHKGNECGEDAENKANAEFIVRAVNNHEALLSACKFALERFKVTSQRRQMDSLYVSELEKAIQQAEGGK